MRPRSPRRRTGKNRIEVPLSPPHSPASRWVVAARSARTWCGAMGRRHDAGRPARALVTEGGRSNWLLRGDIGLSVDQAPSFSMAAIRCRPERLLPSQRDWLIATARRFLGRHRRRLPLQQLAALEGTYEYRTAAGGKNRQRPLPDCTTRRRRSATRRPPATSTDQTGPTPRLHRRPRPHRGRTRRRSPPLISISALLGCHALCRRRPSASTPT